jgi:hypothetical protein
MEDLTADVIRGATDFTLWDDHRICTSGAVGITQPRPWQYLDEIGVKHPLDAVVVEHSSEP